MGCCQLNKEEKANELEDDDLLEKPVLISMPNFNQDLNNNKIELNESGMLIRPASKAEFDIKQNYSNNFNANNSNNNIMNTYSSNANIFNETNTSLKNEISNNNSNSNANTTNYKSKVNIKLVKNSNNITFNPFFVSSSSSKINKFIDNTENTDNDEIGNKEKINNKKAQFSTKNNILTMKSKEYANYDETENNNHIKNINDDFNTNNTHNEQFTINNASTIDKDKNLKKESIDFITKNSNFNNSNNSINNNNPLLNNYSLSSFSYQKDNENDFDCYEHSKEIFNYLNDIRLNPSISIELIEEISNKIKTDGDIDYLEIESLPYQGGAFIKGKYQLKNGKKGFKDLLMFLNSIKDKSFEPILWSEKAYHNCELAIVNFNGLNINYSDDEEPIKKYSDKSNNVHYNNNNSLLKQDTKNKNKAFFKSQSQASLEGSFSPSISTILLLAEELNHIRESLLTDNFDTGACCYSNSEEDFIKGIAVLICGIKKQREERLLETPTINCNELDLDDPIFNYINYKNEIESGDFRVENGLLIATFILDDNSTRIERIVI